MAVLRRRGATLLRRVADRVSPAPAPAPAPTAEDRLLRLLFPTGLDARSAHLVDHAAGADDLFDASTVRRVLGTVDQQASPSRVSVRASAADLHAFEVHGRTLFLDRADMAVSAQIRDGIYEPHVIAVLEQLLRPGQVYVDVGANIGYQTILARHLVGRSGRAVAVEANPDNARLVRLSALANGFDDVEVLAVALADRRGLLAFAPHLGSNGGIGAADEAGLLGSGHATVVPATTLDDLGLDRIDVLKIDVEGAEPLVVAGGLATIRRCRPVIVMEFSAEMTRRVGRTEPDEHLGRLLDLGYRLQVIDRTTHRPGEPVSVDELLATWGDPVRLEDLLLTPVPARADDQPAG